MNRQSQMCRQCYLVQIVRPRNYVQRTCRKCGRAFTVHKCHVERGQAKYCSRACARSVSTRKKLSPMVECQTCGKRFNKFKSDIRKNRGTKHFCTTACWYSYNQRDNHYLWTGGENERMNPEAASWRKKVMDRDKWHCRVCYGGRQLEAHHIHPFGTHRELRWEVSNGITLCHRCHVQFRHEELQHAELLSFIASVPLVVWKP